MGVEYFDTKRQLDTKTNLASNLNDREFGFATDENEMVIMKPTATPVYLTSNEEFWTIEGDTIKTDGWNLRLQNANGSKIAVGNSLKSWDSTSSVIQVGDVNTISMYADESALDCGIIGNGAYYNGTAWKNGAASGYASNICYNSTDGFKIRFSTANTADATITWDDTYKLLDDDCEFNIDEFKLKNSSGVSIMHIKTNGVSFFGPRTAGEPIQINNFEIYTKTGNSAAVYDTDGSIDIESYYTELDNPTLTDSPIWLLEVQYYDGGVETGYIPLPANYPTP